MTTTPRLFVRETTDASFQADIQGELPVLLKFWASWCGPCKTLAPVVEELAEELQGKAQVFSVNIDENPELTERFKISGVPNLILLKQGEPVFQSVGALPKATLQERLKPYLSG